MQKSSPGEGFFQKNVRLRDKLTLKQWQDVCARGVPLRQVLFRVRGTWTLNFGFGNQHFAIKLSP